MFIKKNRKYALILGGGGAKGSYQIGVINILKKMGFHFNAIIGTSVGSLNGAIICQNELKNAINLWKNITLNDVIVAPKELFINGEFKITKDNFKYINNFQKKLLKNHGFDTTPLRNLLSKYVDEDKIRKSGIDFGVITYDVNKMQPVEIFINEIEKGLVVDYLLASSSIPGFQATKIKDKILIDGGVYDNVPLSLAIDRGYKNIIVIDVSGLGMSKDHNNENTEIIYIKNSIDFGNVLDFNPKHIKDNIKLGELDTLKIFGKISGVKYFFLPDTKIMDKLENLLFSENVFEEYKKYFDLKKIKFNKNSILENIRNILPEKYRKNKDIIISLMECSATGLEIEILKIYKFKDLVSKIWDNFKFFKEKEKEKNASDINNFVSAILKINPKEIFDKNKYFFPSEFILIDSIFFNLKPVLHLFPEIIPARIFYVILKNYFGN